MAPEGKSFGAYLRELRLAARYGLREFARRTGLQPSNLSNLERGKLPPPRDPERLEQIADVLELLEGSPERQRLYDLAAEEQGAPLPADAQAYASRRKAIPVLLRTAESRNLTDDDLRQLIDHINKHF